jgi:hypothetical protein
MAAVMEIDDVSATTPLREDAQPTVISPDAPD